MRAIGDPLPSFNGCDSLDDKVESESAAENTTPSEQVDNTQEVEKEEPNEELGSGTDEPTSNEMKLVYFNTAINGIDYISPDGNGIYNLSSGLKIEDIMGVLVDEFYYAADSSTQQGEQYVFESQETEFIADIVVEKETNGIVALVLEYKMIVGLAAFIIALLGIAKIILNR